MMVMSAESPVVVTPRKQEVRVPERNFAEDHAVGRALRVIIAGRKIKRFGSIHTAYTPSGELTTVEKIKSEQDRATSSDGVTIEPPPLERGPVIKRPLALRTTRTHLASKARDIMRQLDSYDNRNNWFLGEPRPGETPEDLIATRTAIFGEGHARDEILIQYLNQGRVTVDLPGLGEQSVNYTKIDPPESRQTAETKSKPPIFFIPGIYNDIDCVGALVQEIAYSGRKIVVMGLPESFMGHVTPQFAAAVAKSQSYEHHAQFYKKAITELMKDAPEFELWGLSLGSAVGAELLNDPAIQQKVSNAVFFSPASVVDQNVAEQALGLFREMAMLRDPNRGKYIWTIGRKKDVPQKTKAEKEDRQKVVDALLKLTRKQNPAWKTAQVKQGGKIIVESGGKDSVTKSAKATDLFAANPQIEVYPKHDARHGTPLIRPEEFLREISERQRG